MQLCLHGDEYNNFSRSQILKFNDLSWVILYFHFSINRCLSRYFSNNCKNNNYRRKLTIYCHIIRKSPFDKDIDICFKFPSYLTTNALQLLFSGTKLNLVLKRKHATVCGIFTSTK